MKKRSRNALLDLLGDRGVSKSSLGVINDLLEGRRMFSISIVRRFVGSSARTVKRFCASHGIEIVSAEGRLGSKVDLPAFLMEWEKSGIEQSR